MIKIEKNVPRENVGRKRKYKEFIDAYDSLGYEESFVVNDWKIVDSIRAYAWKKKAPCSYRTIDKNTFRIYKI